MADLLLLTGRPGVGKTTLIRRLAEDPGVDAGGFCTEEVRLGDAVFQRVHAWIAELRPGRGSPKP